MENATPETTQALDYGNEDAQKFAKATVEQINTDLEARETESVVFNGMKYSDAYAYNQRKAVNYAPPRSKKDDREISSGIVHEKLIGFVALFLKYVFKYHIKAYREGELVPRLGDVYELGIEFSRKLENFKFKVALIYWEAFTQGDCFVLEDWQVKTIEKPKVLNVEGVELKPEEMDYTYEFLETLSFAEGEKIQVRRAESVILDGRHVILGDPELDSGIQDQPRVTIEEKISCAEAEAIFGTLKMYGMVPNDRQALTAMGYNDKTLFNSDRLEDLTKNKLVHRYMDKENNRFNLFLNGVMLLPYNTPFTLFYPRNNYPISQICTERMKGSAYSRSVPMKTKFNVDFLDWVLKKIALKFEQGIEPALIARGKYTLTRDIFRAGNVTHGVSKDDFDKVDETNNGLTNGDFGFFKVIKDIIEAQTTNATTSGEATGGTATEIAIMDQNQQRKLAFLLDALTNGFFDMAMRRCETIESKFTRMQKETVVDGKNVKVYQDFAISVAGVQNIVAFDDGLRDDDFDMEGKQNELFQKAYKSKEANNPTEYYLVDPEVIRSGELVLDIEVRPEQLKDSQLQLIQMFDEFTQTVNLFGRSDQGGRVNIDEMQKEYLQVTGRSEDFFQSNDLAQDPEMQAALAEAGQGGAYNTGSFGKPSTPKPKISDAVKNNALGNK